MTGDVAAATVVPCASHAAEAVVLPGEAQVAQKGKDDSFFIVDDIVGGDGDFAARDEGLQPSHEEFVFGTTAGYEECGDAVPFDGP